MSYVALLTKCNIIQQYFNLNEYMALHLVDINKNRFTMITTSQKMYGNSKYIAYKINKRNADRDPGNRYLFSL